MQKYSLIFWLTISFAPLNTFAQTCTGFCFPEGGSQLGSGTFQQYIPPKGLLEVPGDIPVGIKNFYVELTAEVDVDIQLYDIDTNRTLVGWKINALIDSGKEMSADYNGVTIEYSGYNGIVCGDRGHEYIKITGTTRNNFRMKLYGYKEGQATVNYSYEGAQGAGIPAGQGSFEQQVPAKAVVAVPGDIPQGINNLSIKLSSDVDVDVQLYDVDTNTPLVGWRIGALIDSGRKTSKMYNGVTIEYSGYNGDVVSRGNEYIKLLGITRNRLQMKLYGYQEGYATIKYSWDASQ